jgi:hypothetical protein
MRPSTRLGSLMLRRGFASSARRLDNYSFIGLGQMVCILLDRKDGRYNILTWVYQGYQMARNLQSKLKPSDKVSIFDINPESMKGLETEMKAASTGAQVGLAASAFDASKDAVSLLLLATMFRFADTL